ncbi:integrase [Desulfomicrobium macestii]|uniref:Integrase n=1 Tax=Desulfomicrobium macestii TaxID=90731 RepID=A0ABR9H7P1_9BACT|nr:site-specific integrase [Desulfomicrobium macestii]MBE1426729.1 integrase [Desulfomicrobium macestii]
MGYEWKKTKYEGIRYREHPTRQHGVRKDRYYVLRQRVNGRRVEEALGWESQGFNLQKVREIQSALLLAAKTGSGPRTLAEMRAADEQARKREEENKEIERNKSISISDYWDTYLAFAKTKKGESSWEKEESHYRNWISQVLGDVPIRELYRLEHWDKLMAVLVDANLAPRTRQYVAFTLRQCVVHAYKRGMVDAPPPQLKDVGAVLKPNSNQRTRVISTEEFKQILNNLREKDEYAYRMTVFAAITCCRASQAYDLEWGDIDFSERTALVKEKDHTKRKIYLGDKVMDMLRDMDRVGDYVFVNESGDKYKQAPKSFANVVKKLGLNKGRRRLNKIVFHSLRHTGATRLGKLIPLRDLMDVIGWKTATIAMRYQKTEKEIQDKATIELEKMVLS